MPKGVKGFQKGNSIGRNASEETRRKLSEASKGNTRGANRKGYAHSEETKLKIGLGNKGKVRSEEFKERLSQIGYARSEEINRRISKTLLSKSEELSLRQKGKHHSPETEFKIGHEPVRYWLGKERSEETKEKLRKSNLGKEGYWKGKSLSIEARHKMSIAKKGKFIKSDLSLENLSIINELIRRSFEYRIWREEIFKRDNWTCKKTGKRGGNIRAHHIKNFSQYKELRFSLDNGITLSEEAHNEFHKIYGKQNNTQEQLEEFLGYKL